MADTVKSKTGILIRLTEERWFHITENHDDLAGYYEDVLGTVEEPDYIIEAHRGALAAVRRISKDKFLVVIYKECREDGFIITAYFTTKLNINEEVVLWRKQ